MAIGTITKVSGYTVSNKRYRVYTVQLSAGANYTTGGETITPANVGLSRKIEEARPHGLAFTASGTTSRTVGFLYQTDGSVKILTHTTASAEAANNSDQSTFSVRVTFVGV
jgi:hypothetical protein